MSEPTLEWRKRMTSVEASQYLLTGGFIAVELYRVQRRRIAELEAELARVREQMKAALQACYNPGPIIPPKVLEILKAALDHIPDATKKEQR